MKMNALFLRRMFNQLQHKLLTTCCEKTLELDWCSQPFTFLKLWAGEGKGMVSLA